MSNKSFVLVIDPSLVKRCRDQAGKKNCSLDALVECALVAYLDKRKIGEPVIVSESNK